MFLLRGGERKILSKFRCFFKELTKKCKDRASHVNTKVLSSVSALSTSLILMQIPASAEVDTTIATGLSTWSSVLATIWSMIQANPLLAALSAGALISLGIGLFGKFKHRC